MDYQKNVNPETMEAVGLFRRYTKGDSLHIEKWFVPAGAWVDHPGLAGWASAIGGADDFLPVTEPEALEIIEAWGSPAEKGGATSGNWGHRGRPGQRGGSLPGGGHAAIGAKPGMSRTDVIGRRTLTKRPEFRKNSTALGMAKFKIQVAARNPEALIRAEQAATIRKQKAETRMKKAQEEAEKHRKETYGPEYQEAADDLTEDFLRELGPHPTENELLHAKYEAIEELAKEYGITQKTADGHLNIAIEEIHQERAADMAEFAGDPPNEAQVRGIEAFEAIHNYEPIETAHVFNAKGTLVFVKSDGRHDSISFEGEELWDMHGEVLVHNHPTGQSLSRPDVYMSLSSGLGSMVASGEVDWKNSALNGNEYRHTIAPDKKLRDRWGTDLGQGSIVEVIETINYNVKNDNMREIYAGFLDMQEAEVTHMHTVWTLADEVFEARGWGTLNYTRELTN